MQREAGVRRGELFRWSFPVEGDKIRDLPTFHIDDRHLFRFLDLESPGKTSWDEDLPTEREIAQP